MPGPPVAWNESSPVRDYRWDYFTVAVDGSDGVNPQVRYSGRGATLISPSYAVCAHHARGSGLGFYWVPYAGGSEVKRTSTLTNGVDYWLIDINFDLGLIKLNSPITTIDPIPVLVDSSHAAGQPCVAIEMDRHLNRMVVSPTTSNTLGDVSINRPGDAPADAIEGGDSGKPVVSFIDGEPVLIVSAMEFGGSSSASGPNPSRFIDEINAILAGSGEELTLWDVTASSNGGTAMSPQFSPAFSPSSVPLAYIGA